MLTPAVWPTGPVHDSCHALHRAGANETDADYAHWCSECRHYHTIADPCILPLGGTRVL
jgi:hypothetical protein